MTMEDQVQAIKERQNSFETEMKAFTAKVDMYMNMMNQQRAEDRQEMRELRQEMRELHQDSKELRQEVSTTVKHIQNLVVVTLLGVGAMVIAVLMRN